MPLRPIRTVGRAIAAPAVAITGSFQRFLRTETASGMLLLGAAVVALIWANSSWGETYEHLWHQPLTLQLGQFKLTLSLHHWINDGLMAIFFLLVGLEIKREVMVGELSTPRLALMPIATALGGMLIPAGIYAVINWNGPAAHGWGIPMATDIAFALGILALAGRGVPLALKVMLTALAIVDDLGAVIVIAIFYTDQLDINQLMYAGGLLLVLLALNLSNVRALLPYLLVGAVLWLVVLKSGVHATIAGVVLAMTIPVRSKFDKVQFMRCMQQGIREFQDSQRERDTIMLNEGEQSAIYFIETTAHGVQPPLQRLEHNLKDVVAFFIMPLFALVNAGVVLGSMSWGDLAHPALLGVSLGLLLGKPLGILFAAWLVVRMRWADLPTGATWLQVAGLACLGGIGFTMSLFIAELAFPGEASLLHHAKLGILIGTFVSAILGTILLRRAMRNPAPGNL